MHTETVLSPHVSASSSTGSATLFPLFQRFHLLLWHVESAAHVRHAHIHICHKWRIRNGKSLSVREARSASCLLLPYRLEKANGADFDMGYELKLRRVFARTKAPFVGELLETVWLFAQVGGWLTCAEKEPAICPSDSVGGHRVSCVGYKGRIVQSMLNVCSL